MALCAQDDPVAAESAFESISATGDYSAWRRWGLLAARLAQERVNDAIARRSPPPRGAAALADWLPAGTVSWSRSGSGSIACTDGTARFVGLGGAGVELERKLDGISNAQGWAVEFVARRVSGSPGDSRISISDGSVREVVYLDAESVRQLNGDAAIPLATNRPHHYLLWVQGQSSRLYIDGQLALHALGLESASSRTLRFGIEGGIAGADSESQWWFVRLIQLDGPSDRAPVVPRPWPSSLWLALAGEAQKSGRWTEALSLVTRARLLYPHDDEVRQTLHALLETARGDEDLYHTYQRALNQLTLSDRNAVTAPLIETAAPLLVADSVGVSFSRMARGTSIRALVRRLRDRSFRPNDRFWAVRGVSFQLRPGAMLAIIGRNGAGKTTLLRMIAGLVEPEEGSISVLGRRMLLSAGGNFLPDLTGRENIHLAGLYLGMTRKEIITRVDEIIEFAELWDAIDRPFRTYSTGMMSRLQFALATTVDPEILMLDELLGAGDASFMEKAQTRMNRLLRRARAVILVTHNLEFVRNTCTAAILIERGQVLYQGSPERASTMYEDLLTKRPKRAERAE